MSEQEGAATFGKSDRSSLRQRPGKDAPRVPDVAPWQSRVVPELSFWPGRRCLLTRARKPETDKTDSPKRPNILPSNTRLVAGNMAAVSGLDMSMLTYTARLATFNTEHQLTKRRASNQKKKQPSAVSWPHESPSGEEVAFVHPLFISTHSDHDSLLAPASSSNPHPTATTMLNVFTAP